MMRKKKKNKKKEIKMIEETLTLLFPAPKSWCGSWGGGCGKRLGRSNEDGHFTWWAKQE
jgi:hypothetical protein